MKLTNKIKILILSFLLIVQLFVPLSMVYALPGYTEKQVTVSNYITGNDENVNIRLYEEIPYIKLSVIYELLMGSNITITDQGSGVFNAVTTKGSATFDTVNNTFHTNDYISFISSSDDNSELPASIKEYNMVMTGDAKETNIDYTKYEINLYADTNDVWLPVQTALDMFMKMGFYDGNNINIVDGSYADEDDYNTKIAAYFVGALNTTSNTKFAYNELCFVLDNFYGYPKRSILSESIKNNGLDYTLQNYNADTVQIRSWLLSTDFKEYYAGLLGLSAYLYDGGHTDLASYFENFLYDGYFDEQEQGYALYEQLEIAATDEAKKDAALGDRASVQNARDNTIGDVGYYEQGDTALVIINEMSYDRLGWKDYYEHGGEYPDDTLGNVLTALDKAKANKEIKNFVFDVAKNNGGSVFVPSLIMAFLGYDNPVREKNTITDQIQTSIMKFDTNFDGVYNSDDLKSKYNFNYAVLTSDTTFSSANLFAALAKDNGFMILGEQSGGGACSVQGIYSSEGVFYQISSYGHSIDNSNNSIDNGIEIDKNLVTIKDNKKNYEKFYDFNLLSSEINAFYSNKSKNETEKVPATGDNIAKYVVLFTISLFGLSTITISKCRRGY